MKGISKGFVFDTENAILLASSKNKKKEGTSIYITGKGRYFAVYEYNELNDNKIIISFEYLGDNPESIDEMLSEFSSNGNGYKSTINFEHFELG